MTTRRSGYDLALEPGAFAFPGCPHVADLALSLARPYEDHARAFAGRLPMPPDAGDGG
jgi:hypothetical protein